MVKVYAPMMSLDASGTVADAITFAKWKGRSYVRSRVLPSNPQSGGQVGRRAMFTFLTQKWDALLTAEKTTWQDLADELVASPFNAYLSENMKGWHNFLSPGQESPIARSNNGSDRALIAASWQENRIKLTSSAGAAHEQWGMIYFATTGTGFTPSVGNAIIAELDPDTALRSIYWTPPTVTTWYFNSITFSDDGVKEAAGGERSAAP